MLLSGFGSFVAPFPSNITLRTAVLTNTVPLAYFDENYTTSDASSSDADAITSKEPFPQYRGFQPDLLRHLVEIAQTLDNVTLTLELEQAPPFSYKYQYEYTAVDCNISVYYDIEIPEEHCNRLDFVTGDFYGYPTRSFRSLLSPPLLTTAAATMQYVHRQARQITTLEEAQTLQEPVCLLDDSHFDVEVLKRFPNLVVLRCYKDHLECIHWLKEEKCALFVEDELQLRHLMVQDVDLGVTQEHFNEQYIVWPINSRLDPTLQRLLVRWIYQAKVSGVLDELYDKYFSVTFCPLGRAGANCDEPCSPPHGSSDRFGNCLCESARWTGDDCTVEVIEDKNLIPTSLIIVSYVMIGINFAAAGVCAVWLVWSRNTTQVKVAQPLFLGLVLLGCLISTSTIFALAQEESADIGQTDLPACQATPWLYFVGFCITFGSLFAKICRVFHLFQAAARMQRTSFTTKDTIIIVSIVLSVDIVILTIWTVVDPLQWERFVLTADKYGVTLSSQGYCTCDTWLIFAGIIAAYHFLLMGIACLMCYKARDIPTEFSEGKYVAIAMVSNLQIFVVGLPVLLILGTDSETSFFVRSVIIWMNDFAVLVLIFGNLIWSVHFDQAKFDSGVIESQLVRSAINSFHEKRELRAINAPKKDSSIVPRNQSGVYSSYPFSNQSYDSSGPLPCTPIAEIASKAPYSEDSTSGVESNAACVRFEEDPPSTASTLRREDSDRR